MSQTKNMELIGAIILAAVLVAGSLVFLGVQLGQKPENTTPALNDAQLEEQVETELLAEVPEGGESEPEGTVPANSESQLKEQIKTEILAELKEGDFLAQEIEAGIERYIQKQREAQEKARAEQARVAAEKAKDVPRPSVERDHIYGNPDAVISLIEYSDFECPYCKAFHATAKQFVDESDGQVNWVFRHYPLGFHNPTAQKEAEATECVAELGGNEAFWKFADAIFENSALNGKGVPADILIDLVEKMELDAEQFQTCLDSEKHAKRVLQDLQEGTDSGITGTPGNILLNNQTGNVKLMSGAVPLESLQTEMEQLLK
jgi:protein-disulfide isomerase